MAMEVPLVIFYQSSPLLGALHGLWPEAQITVGELSAQLLVSCKLQVHDFFHSLFFHLYYSVFGTPSPILYYYFAPSDSESDPRIQANGTVRVGASDITAPNSNATTTLKVTTEVSIATSEEIVRIMS